MNKIIKYRWNTYLSGISEKNIQQKEFDREDDKTLFSGRTRYAKFQFDYFNKEYNQIWFDSEQELLKSIRKETLNLARRATNELNNAYKKLNLIEDLIEWN